MKRFLDKYNGYPIYDGPGGHLFLEIINNTEQDALWFPQFFKANQPQGGDSRFESVMDNDTVLMAGGGFIRIEKGTTRIYDANGKGYQDQSLVSGIPRLFVF